MFTEIVKNELLKCKKSEILDFKLKEQGLNLAPPQYRTAIKINNKDKMIWFLYWAIQDNIERYYALKMLRNGHAKNVLFKIYEFKVLHFLVGRDKFSESAIDYYNYLIKFSLENVSFLDLDLR